MEGIIVHSLHPYSKHEERHGLRETPLSRFPFMEKTHGEMAMRFLLRLLSLCLNLFGTFQQGIMHPDLKMTLKTPKQPQNSPLLPLSSLQTSSKLLQRMLFIGIFYDLLSSQMISALLNDTKWVCEVFFFRMFDTW